MLLDNASTAGVSAQAELGQVSVTDGGPLALITMDQATKVRLDLLDCGYSPVAAMGKRPVVKGWPSFANRAPSKLAIKKWSKLQGGAASNTGIACGCIRVIDLDIDDEALCFKAREIIAAELRISLPCRVGRWPRVALFARQSEQSRQTIRRNYRQGSVEYLGANGHVIVHGIHPDTGKAYYWIDDPLWEIPVKSLPTITREQENRIGVKLAKLLGGPKKPVSIAGTTTIVGATDLIPDGQRNLYLKEKLHVAVAKAKSEAELRIEADLINGTCFQEPLLAPEIKKQVRYWWKIKESGKLLVKGGEPAAFLRKSEHEKIGNPNATSLLMLLRISHGYARVVQFCIVPEKMTKRMGIGIKPIRAARDRLLLLGLIKKVGGAGKQGDPYKYMLT